MAKRKRINDTPIFAYWATRLEEVFLSAFKYKNMPEEVNVYALERTLCRNGFAIFFKWAEKYFALESVKSGVDVYGYPTHYLPISRSSQIQFTKQYNTDECVPIQNKQGFLPFLPIINYYAEQLTEVDQAIRVNTIFLKKPIKGIADDKTITSITNSMNKYQDSYCMLINTPTISNMLDNFKTMDFGVTPTEILNLLKIRETVLNNFYNEIGIEGGIEKRERIIQSEISSINAQTKINKSIYLDTRKDAVDKINKMFDLNIEVEFNNDIIDLRKEVEMNELQRNIKGVKDNSDPMAKE